MITVEVFHISEKKTKTKTNEKEQQQKKKQKQTNKNNKNINCLIFIQQKSNLSRRSHTSTLPSVLVIKNTPEKKIIRGMDKLFLWNLLL